MWLGEICRRSMSSLSQSAFQNVTCIVFPASLIRSSICSAGADHPLLSQHCLDGSNLVGCSGVKLKAGRIHSLLSKAQKQGAGGLNAVHNANQGSPKIKRRALKRTHGFLTLPIAKSMVATACSIQAQMQLPRTMKMVCQN